jgi:membrane-associated phospholipid phosphatase
MTVSPGARRTARASGLACAAGFGAVLAAVKAQPDALIKAETRLLVKVYEQTSARPWLGRLAAVGHAAGRAKVSDPIGFGTLGYCLLRRDLRGAACFFGTATLGSALSKGLKRGVNRSRPEIPGQKEVYDEPSFPSGHALQAISLYGAITVFVLRPALAHRPAAAQAATGAVAAGVGLIGSSRLMLGVHHPTDVLGGYLLGAAVLLLSRELALLIPRRTEESDAY